MLQIDREIPIQEKGFMIFFINVFFNINEKQTYDFLFAIDKKFINITEHSKFNIKKFANVLYNFDIDFYKLLIENIVFEDDYSKCLIAGGCFSVYKNNRLSLQFPTIYNYLEKHKDIDIYIETNNIKKYVQKYSKKLIKNTRIYPLCFYTMKFNWKNLKINFIFTKKNIGIKNVINNFDFDFCKIFYSYEKKSIFLHYRLFEEFDVLNLNYGFNIKPKYLNFYENYLIDIRDRMILEEYFSLDKNFIRYKLMRYVKYLFKGFYCKNQENCSANIVFFFENILKDNLDLN